jgi:cytochrome c-type biogenesis protein CcmH
MRRTTYVFGFVVWLALVVRLSVLAGVAAAQDGAQPTPTPAVSRVVTQDDVNRIARQMYCPICENEPLDACRTAACAQWKAQIAQMLADGKSDDEIKQYFVDTFGLKVLASPPVSGVTVWLWLLPIVALIIGAVYVYTVMRRMRARSAASSSAASPPSSGNGDEYVDRVERDLKNW